MKIASVGSGLIGMTTAYFLSRCGVWTMGQFEIADHANAIRELGARLSFLDLERVGVSGMTWGGQFAFRPATLCIAMVTHPLESV